jgi:hypothetical protein
MPGNSSIILSRWQTNNGCAIDALTFAQKTMTMHSASFSPDPANQATTTPASHSCAPPNTVIVTAGVGEVAYIFTDHDHMTVGENNCAYVRAG